MFRWRTGPFATPFQDKRDDLICEVLRGKESVAHVKVVGGRVELSDEVGMHISLIRGPEDGELTLLHAVSEPMEAHVKVVGEGWSLVTKSACIFLSPGVQKIVN